MAKAYDQLPSIQLLISHGFGSSFVTDFVLALALSCASLQNVIWLKEKLLSIWLLLWEKIQHSFTGFIPE